MSLDLDSFKMTAGQLTTSTTVTGLSTSNVILERGWTQEDHRHRAARWGCSTVRLQLTWSWAADMDQLTSMDLTSCSVSRRLHCQSSDRRCTTTSSCYLHSTPSIQSHLNTHTRLARHSEFFLISQTISVWFRPR